MKKLLSVFIKIIFSIFLFIVLLAGIDYYRMSNMKKPIFCNSFYDGQIETCKGILHTTTRKVRVKTDEPLEDSSDFYFNIFIFSFKIPKKDVEKPVKYTIDTVEKKDCSDAKLYYADLDIKVYTYCLDSIELNHKEFDTFLKEDNSILEDVENFIGFKGKLNEDVLEFESTDNNLRIFQCDKENINDVTIGPYNMKYLDSFCTYKDDDFSFLWTIVDETPKDLEPTKNEQGEVIPEVVYEDSEYRYQFELPKSNYVYVYVPKVRGKEEKKYPFKSLLQNNTLTMDQLIERGLDVKKVKKGQ